MAFEQRCRRAIFSGFFRHEAAPIIRILQEQSQLLLTGSNRVVFGDILSVMIDDRLDLFLRQREVREDER